MIGVTNCSKDLAEGTTRPLYNCHIASGFETIRHPQPCKTDTYVQKKPLRCRRGQWRMDERLVRAFQKY